MRFQQLILIAAAMAAALTPLLSQSPTPDKGQQVIDQAIAALGGQQFLDMRTRVASGRAYSFFHDELSGLDLANIYTEYLPAATPGNLGIQERERLGKKQDYSYLFLPDGGWDITFRGARPIPDESWERYVRTTRHDILYLLRTRGHKPGAYLDYVGNQVYLSRHIEIVDVTDEENQSIRVYFDYNTKLPIRQTFSWVDPQTKDHDDEVSDFDKWRNIGGGIMWPFSIERQRNGYKSYQFFADKVEANAPIPPKTFELPPGAKLLRKVN